MTGLEAAITMYHREHDRWHQWSLFFFGSIAGVFALWGQLHAKIGLWAPSGLACAICCVWVMVSLNIRATSRAWRETVKELELAPGGEGPAFKIFGEKLEEFERLYDLRETLTQWRDESFLSVTRVLTLFGVVAAVIFFILFVAACIGAV